MNIKPEVEIIYVPERFIRFAVRRTRAMIKRWALTDADSISGLVAAAYLQGASDGFEAAQRQKEKREKKGC